MRKGNLVRLNPALCFTQENGGERNFPLSNYYRDNRGEVEGIRIPTKKEIEDWRNSDAAKGMTSGGDSKLPPTAYAEAVHRDRVYIVVRARCNAIWNYRNHPGQTLILDTDTGHELYVKRELLEVVK